MRPKTMLLLCAVALALLVADRPHAQSLPPKLEIKTFQLPNGLRFAMLEDHTVPLVTLQVWYHVGSKDEASGRTGFAHLFEHLMFKGSARLEPNLHSLLIQEMGGGCNAFTAQDHTYFDQTFPSNYLERVMWMEADRMHSLSVNEANFVSEREVVKEERRMRIDNQPYGNLPELIMKNAFHQGPYGHVPVGSMEDLNKASAADVGNFYKTFYRPDNALVVIVGDFDPARARRLAKKHFGTVPAGRQAVPRPPAASFEPARAAHGERRVVEYDARIQLPAIVRAYYTPQIGDLDNYALDVAALILSGGQSSRLYNSLVYRKRLALVTGGLATVLQNAGLFYAFAVMSPGSKVGEGEAALDAVIEELREKPVDPRELTKAKNQIISSLIFDRQKSGPRAQAIGRTMLLLGDPGLVNNDAARYLQITAADVQRVAKKYFGRENRVVVTLLPAAQRPSAPVQ